MTFDPSKYGLSNQDVFDAFTNNPANASKLANEAGISAKDLSDWANTVPGGGGWSPSKVNQMYGVNIIPSGISSSSYTGSYKPPTSSTSSTITAPKITPTLPPNYGTTSTIPGNNTNPVSQVKMPGFVDSQASMNASIPKLFNSLTGYMPKFDAAYDTYSKLPETIEQWRQEALKNERLTGDDSAQILNSVANSRAGKGIMGGTEANNLTSNLFAKSLNNLNTNKNTINQYYDTLKGDTISKLPSTALSPVITGDALYGTTSNEAYNWGNMAANMLLSGF